MRALTLATLLSFVAPLAAQDMIAVSWGGNIYALDSFTGTKTFLSTGFSGQNALAIDDNGTAWSTRKTGSIYSLTSIDLTTGTATEVYPNFFDIRALTSAGGTELWAIRRSPTELVRIDTATGTHSSFGGINLSSVQSITMLDGTLYGWSLNNGLLTIDTSNGQGSYVPFQSGSVGGAIQWLARRADGKLIGGGSDIYEIDPATGDTTLIGSPGVDLRGAEPAYNFTRNYGQACNGEGGLVASSAAINGGVGSMLTLQSTNHAANTVGLVIFGGSSMSASGAPLPVNVDFIFGTMNCWLNVSLDVSIGAVTTSTFPATLDLQVPILASWPGNALFVQHAVLENVPGGLSLSDGVVVQFGY